MRIITGTFRGRQIKAVPGNQTRPTSDKVKESSFQMIGPYFEGGYCLDLFAGSGNLGLEAMSRGMDHAVFVDINSKAIQTIKQNIQNFQVEDRTHVLRMNALKAISFLKRKGYIFDLIFVDPPYEKLDYSKVLSLIVKEAIIAEDGLIYCEHLPENELHIESEDFSFYKHVKYSNAIAVTIFKHHKKREGVLR